MGERSDILFGQSYYLRFDPKLWDAMQPYPPLGTLYAASYMRARGYAVALFDAMLAPSEAEWAAALERHRPRYAVLFEDNFNYLSKMCLLRMREAAFTMVGMARARGCVTVVCGADATDHADAYLARGADYVLIGEGEETLGELLDSLEWRSTRPVAEIAGLAAGGGRRAESRRQTADGGRGTGDEGRWTAIGYPPSAISHPPSAIGYPPSAISHPPSAIGYTRRPDMTDLDALPFPAWDLVDVERYRRIWLRRHGYFSMNMVTTRGCPYHCNWCAKPIWGQRYNSRSPANVAAEMRWLKETYRPDHIWFADDILGLKPRWLEQFAQQVAALDCAVPFKCLLRADLVKPPVVAALAAARCKTVWIGAESGSQKILDAMDKGTTVADIRRATRLLQAAGIKVGFFLQFGYPGETRADVELTLQMVRACLPDDIGISVSYPLPGTKFYERVRTELGAKQNWQDSSDLATLYRAPFPQAFYRTLHTVVHREFRMRRALREVREALRRPGTLRPAHLRRAASIPYQWAGWQINRRKLNAYRQKEAQGRKEWTSGDGLDTESGHGSIRP